MSEPYRFWVAAWTTRRGRYVPVSQTISRTAREARKKAGQLWDGGWAYARKHQDWRIVPVTVTLKDPAP